MALTEHVKVGLYFFLLKNKIFERSQSFEATSSWDLSSCLILACHFLFDVEIVFLLPFDVVVVLDPGKISYIKGRVFWLKLGIENSDPGCPIRIYKINFEEVTNVFQRQYEAVIGDNLRPAEEGAILSQAALHFLELRVFWEGHLHDDKFLGKRVCLHLKN